MNSKTISLKDKKLISEKLRNENKKMEVRLQQLKLTMSKEKEERLLSGNSSMWGAGAPGAVLNYKPNLSALDKGKKLKLKILREEDEINQPEGKDSSQTHHLKQLSNGDVLSNRGDNLRSDRNNGKKKCGQCEEAFAAVNCNECTEVYCAKCFAVFHLKGALRKHRSTPISNISNRISIPSPLFKPPDFSNFLNNSSRNTKESDKYNKTKNESSNDTNKKSSERPGDFKENQSPAPHGISLADGSYDEAISNQYFQDALLAWRNGEEAPYKPVAPVPLPMTEHSTETSLSGANQKLIDDQIQFTSSLSYAEKLLLRKHRSCQLAPVELKFILNRLSKNSEADILENQRLLQTNLMLETSAINDTVLNGPLSDNCHMAIGSFTELWSEAAYLDEKKSNTKIQAMPISTIDLNDIIKPERNDIKEPLVEWETSALHSESVKVTNSANNNTSQFVDHDQKFLLDPEIMKPSDEITKFKLTSRRSNSAMNKNAFNDRPQSARRMSARNNKGGKLFTQPSVLLKMLASFNKYLPENIKDREDNNVLSSATSSIRFNSAGSKRSTSKLNYNFYKIAPQSWKPAKAWPEKQNNSDHEKEVNTAILSGPAANVSDEYDEELEKLNFYGKIPSSPQFINTVPIERLSSSSSNMSDDNLLNNVDMDCLDRGGEEEQCLEQLEIFERELTLISRKDSELNNDGDYEEIVADSLDLQNYNDSLDVLESDKFHFEDSLDFQQRFSHNSGRIGIDSDDDLRNCSSRFNDYDDVHNLD